jgi:MFS transporter, FHS family, glucose/mannose:H+ symporter
LILFAGFILTGIVNTLLGPVLPWLAARWSLTDAAAGLLFTVQFAGGLAGGFVSGAIAARAGAGRTMAAGHLMMAIGLAAMAAGGFHAGIAGMAISGLGLGFVIPTTNLMAARLEPERAAAALGAVNLCWGFGAAIWPLLVAFFTGRAGLAVGLSIVSLALAAMSVVTSRTVFPASHHIARTSSAGKTGGLARLAMFGACIALYSGTEAAFGGWITEYARRLSGGAASGGWEIAATTFWGGLTAGRAAVAIGLAGRHEKLAMFAGLFVLGAVLAVTLMTPSVAVVLVCAALCGLGLAPVFPVTVAALSREFSTTAAGPMVALGSLGAGTLPLLVGTISDRTGSLTAGLAALLGSAAILIALEIVVSHPSSVSRQSMALADD